ncbi:MAG: hypothetical protein HY875_14555 [Chloroflexi bacterium]|nr:hypothetical protein [Chloroflexota bacterium]
MTALLLERSRRMPPVERAKQALAWCDQLNSLRYELIRQRNPGATEAEVTALWTEETYRDTVEPAFLAKVVAAIRAGPHPPAPSPTS